MEVARIAISESDHERIRTVKDRAYDEIGHYLTSFICDGQGCGSGTFVSAFGVRGILTAHHVAAELFTRKRDCVGLVITQAPSRFSLSVEQAEVISIGAPENEKYVEDGPDLAFVRIFDPEALSTIASKKSFVPLESSGLLDLSKFQLSGLYPGPWLVAGAPSELEEHRTDASAPRHDILTTYLEAEADFVSDTTHLGFDLLRFNVIVGNHGFPTEYGGVSGGSVWFIRFTIDPKVGIESLTYQPPRLVGVPFWQNPITAGKRELVAHGPQSIYVRTVEKLRALAKGSS